jgi:hypothetical protein
MMQHDHAINNAVQYANVEPFLSQGAETKSK